MCGTPRLLSHTLPRQRPAMHPRPRVLRTPEARAAGVSSGKAQRALKSCWDRAPSLSWYSSGNPFTCGLVCGGRVRGVGAGGVGGDEDAAHGAGVGAGGAGGWKGAGGGPGAARGPAWGANTSVGRLDGTQFKAGELLCVREGGSARAWRGAASARLVCVRLDVLVEDNVCGRGRGRRAVSEAQGTNEGPKALRLTCELR